MTQPEPEFDPASVLRRFADAGIDFVVIGCVAGAVHGSAYTTDDIDLAYSCAPQNLSRLAKTLRGMGATPSAERLARDDHLAFVTELGNVDVLARPAGAPAYEKLRSEATTIAVEGRTVRIASLDRLIAMAESMGRTKDKLLAAEYRTIADLLRATGEGD